MFRFICVATCFLGLTTSFLHAAAPDISNLGSCINEVRSASANPPIVQTFDQYKSNYQLLLSDLKTALPRLPYVYQQAAATPLINYLTTLGESRFLQLFRTVATDQTAMALQQMIPDATLALLVYNSAASVGAKAFEEVVSDIYNSFLSDEGRAGRLGGRPINAPTYGVIPPLVKFGNAASGPYTWPGDATYQLLGMRCGIVSLPPAQLKGGIFAWSTLGHETGGHDITHADQGLLSELGNRIYNAIFRRFGSSAFASYWAKCTDEISADALGYLHMGPSVGVSLIGYFRALGNGKLRTMGSTNDTHPIDLLRAYFAAAVVKRLSFADAALWSQTIYNEAQKDNGLLYFVDAAGRYAPFPASFADAIASVDIVAEVILKTPLNALEGYNIQKIIDWDNTDQAIVDQLTSVIKYSNTLPSNLQGAGFYAAYVVAAATQAGMQGGSVLSEIFNNMENYLLTMHFANPTWSNTPTPHVMALLEQLGDGERSEDHSGKHIVRHDLPESEYLEAEQLAAAG